TLHPLIAVRLFDRHPAAVLDDYWFARKLTSAAELRARFFAGPFYRLIHAEGDGLPGFAIDRYGDVFVVQSNTAGADTLTQALLAALETSFKPRAVVLRNDASVRKLEQVPEEVRVAAGDLAGGVFVEEGGCRFPIDPLEGQKTGWFFDLQPARALIASMAKDQRVLDMYCHTGAFSVTAAKAGAKAVHGIDASKPAIAQAQRAAADNGLGKICSFEAGEAFEALHKIRDSGARYDIVICDPPSFVKSKRELSAGARGYRKLVRLAAPVIKAGGFLFVASCSHHMSLELFAEEVAAGLSQAHRAARIIHAGGAGPDHPVHPHLPESAYLKWQVLQVD
ncbi:MAG: class I SAM-dependent rRNA methyltransferase, partial [Alphaproteobacteria bacterium]